MFCIKPQNIVVKKESEEGEASDTSLVAEIGSGDAKLSSAQTILAEGDDCEQPPPSESPNPSCSGLLRCQADMTANHPTPTTLKPSL